MAEVKNPGSRAAKTRETRQRMLRAARELFVERGYGTTALQDVADRAGVAVQTIYFTFGNKRTMLKELLDVTIAGDDEPLATMERPAFRQARDADSAEEHVRLLVRGTRPILERYAPMHKVLQTAAAMDPEVAEVLRPDVDPRFTVMSAMAESLAAKPGARPGLRADVAADVLFGMLSPDLYLVLVEERRWSPTRWEQWVLEVLLPQLCDS
ncbi:TetR/AcrR family transcriptional regulator [Catenulispora sp. NF23]|uniref:TetR/AcrR family transcriptional regulator n=1 Tax=Catenulispora pinistramenti TaxID=2705254 RepID=A0ABS5KT38_9ACTN|nr:TetR/AcrR family transcriptional regulator [Catenulispora pinistramenti]MBS2535072.1 TetR/AcrR family transcriptional regulator [Catenulispora pinistramenti]MBS2549212.1 TetR/AcrR family transcriptional regulator [Catenulispora pinistramenti]